jgi:hypothetical protein
VAYKKDEIYLPEFFSCGPDPKICIYIANGSFILLTVHFSVSLGHAVYTVGGKTCVILNTVSVKKGTAPLYIDQFSQCDISINALVLRMLWYRI